MRKFGLIGYPLGHSFSKKYFTTRFENENIDAKYDLYELDKLEKFENLKQISELCGLNVTIPYKEKIIGFLDELDDTAKKIGAVNVIKFIRTECQLKLKGYNSDTIGFEKSLQPLLKSHHSKALILGTGGASKAIKYVLDNLGISSVFVSRNPSENMLTYQQIDKKILNDFKLIINASPVGTFPNVNQCPDIPYQFLDSLHVLYDLVYNPAETLFMKKGKERGATVCNGEAMLIGQAEAAWQIWNC
jgi:shikimate dehydrogenase